MTRTLEGNGFVLLLDETRMSHDGVHRLYRVQATTDRLRGTVKAGEKGGWLSYPENLSDDAWVADESEIHGIDAQVMDSALVFGKSVLSDHAKVSRSARVQNTIMREASVVTGHAVVRDSQMSGGSMVRGHATVDETDLYDVSWVADSATVSDSALTNNVRIGGDMEIVNCFLSEDNLYEEQYRMEGVQEG